MATWQTPTCETFVSHSVSPKTYRKHYLYISLTPVSKPETYAHCCKIRFPFFLSLCVTHLRLRWDISLCVPHLRLSIFCFVLGAQSIFFISQSAQNLLKRYYSSSTSLPSPFLTMMTQKTQVSTSVLAHVFCILIYPSSMSHGHRGHGQAHWCSPMSYISHISVLVPSTLCGHTGHNWAHWCLLMSYMSLLLSPWPCGNTQDMSEHISACSCPYISLSDTG